MKILSKVMLAASAVSAASMAQAQVNGVATVDSLEALSNAKALATAQTAINTQFAGNEPLITQKQQQLDPLIVKMDSNKDGNVDTREFEAAKKSKVAATRQAATQAEAIQKEIQNLSAPAAMAALYALETLLGRYNTAQNKVVADRRVGALLKPSSFVTPIPPAADITAAVTAELDRTVISLPTTPPANWRPRQDTLQVMEQVMQLNQLKAYARAAAAQRAAAGQPAAGQPAAGQPAAQPAQPAPQTPRPTTPSGR